MLLFMSHRRQVIAEARAALEIVERLDIVKDILSYLIASAIGVPSNVALLEQLEEAHEKR
jgi:hypothetical protein